MTARREEQREDRIEAVAPILRPVLWVLGGAALVCLIAGRLVEPAALDGLGGAGGPGGADASAISLWSRVGLALLLGAPWSVALVAAAAAVKARAWRWALVAAGLLSLAALSWVLA